jgi:hypothetical protein
MVKSFVPGAGASKIAHVGSTWKHLGSTSVNEVFVRPNLNIKSFNFLTLFKFDTNSLEETINHSH